MGLKVMISGGGIAGLALANALEKGNIDYVLLERRKDIAPQVGASIGILANGYRIFDQLGCKEQLDAVVEPVLVGHDRDLRGRMIATKTDAFALTGARTGYAVGFGDRQKILQILYDNLRDKTKVLTSKNTMNVDQLPDGIRVTCEDGSSYTGDILVGADGVNSKIRNELWKLADQKDPDLVREDKDCLSAEYQCLFGIASQSSGLSIGDLEIGYAKDLSSLVIVGKEDRTYYFIFKKLDKVYKQSDLPRFNDIEKDEFAARLGHIVIGDKTRFRDIHKHTISSTLVALEEADFKIWTLGRIVCVGDSIHKMTPNAGFGGNSALESAAALANAIKRLADSTKGSNPTESQVAACLESFHESRKVRASAAIKVANLVTRIQALATTSHWFFAHYCLDVLGDFLQNLMSEINVGAMKIDYLPPPLASMLGTMPFNPEQGEGQKERRLKRAFFALPIFALSIAALYLMDPAPGIPALNKMLQAGRIVAEGIDATFKSSFYGVNWLNKLWAPINVPFTLAAFGYDPVGRTQLLSFLMDYGVIATIWSIEAVRRGSIFTPAQLPFIFTSLGQLLGIGAIAPIYYTLHNTLIPISTFAATDMRLTSLHRTRAIFPSILLTYYIPIFGALFSPNLPARQHFLLVWSAFPLWHAIAQWGISKCWKDTMREDRLRGVKRDVGTIRYTVAFGMAISTGFWFWMLCTNPASLGQILLPGAFRTTEGMGFTDAVSMVLQWDHVILIASTYLWLAYWVWDAKIAGMVEVGWGKLMAMAVMGTLVVGSGAVVGGAWLWREWVITEKRHRAAVTVEKARAEGWEVRDVGMNGKVGEMEKSSRMER